MTKAEHRMQRILNKPNLDEAYAALQKDIENPELWYDYAVALGVAGKDDESIEAFSQGLTFSPFDAYLYFGRGRRLTAGGRFWAGMSDINMATRIDPNNWSFWYYSATANSLNHRYAEAIKDLETCVRLADPNERAPMVHWLYTTYLLELGDKQKAEESLKLFADDTVPRQMDYGYVRCIKLYKGQVSPEEFVDIPDMQEKCVKQENRVNLELNTMYFGLFAYAMGIGDDALADNALKELLKIAVPMAFGYKRGIVYAKKRGLV